MSDLKTLELVLAKLDLCRNSPLKSRAEERFAWKLFTHRHELVSSSVRIRELEAEVAKYRELWEIALRRTYSLEACMAKDAKREVEREAEVARLRTENEKLRFEATVADEWVVGMRKEIDKLHAELQAERSRPDVADMVREFSKFESDNETLSCGCKGNPGWRCPIHDGL